VIAGLISIGTNSTRALVADLDGGTGRTLLHRSTGTRIGEGLKERGHLEEAAMERTLTAIRDHFHAMQHLTPTVRVIATSALRRADNAAEFAARVRDITGATLQIISGDEEARCSFTGAVSGIAAPGDARFGVLDTGGGSTEYALGTKERPERIISCEIGAVRLTEAVPELSGTRGTISEETMDRACSIASTAIAPIGSFPKAEHLVFVGGSATTTISVLAEKRETFAYADLTRTGLQKVMTLLRSLDLEARKNLPGMNPQRADILLAGAVILDAAFKRTLHERAIVSTNDVLLGFLLTREHSR
jgi:exopolyphosphatase / guanosine-5'-triphosphate,3'-diphosphate pyrophosphatase